MRPNAAPLALLLLCTPAHAADLCVTPGGGGGCFASVQAAVDAAGSGDTITIAAGTYVEGVAIGPQIRLTLTGAGSTDTIIDGGGALSVIGIEGPGTTVTISGLTLQNAGYGILAGRARVTVRESVIRDNATAGIRDGCIPLDCFPDDLRLVIEDSAITNNGSETGYGAGIDLQAKRSRATITRCTISGTTGFGTNSNNGVYVARGPLRLVDSTVSGNEGPGVELGTVSSGVHPNPQGIGRIVRSTIAGNVYGLLGSGGFNNRATIDGSIFADNIVDDCQVPNGTVTSRGFNLIETGCSVRQGAADLDLTGVDPVLGPLQDNGGPTETHALLPASPALGVIDRAARCRAPDQRGVPRAAPCDIGAYEAP